MKNLTRTLALLLVMACIWTQSPAAAADAPTIERLAGLCRLWGLVKFCHPHLATKDIDWDAALIKAIPLVRGAVSAEDYEKALRSLVDPLGDPVTSVAKRPAPAGGSSPEPAAPGAGGRTQPYVERTEDGIAVVVANDYRQFSAENTGWVRIIADFKKSFMEAARSPRVLVDLRNLGGPPSYLLDMALSDNLSWLLTRDVPLPPLRFLSYMGYPSQKEPMIYHAELAARSSGCIRAMSPSGPAPALIVFLVNGDSNAVPLHLAALQDNGSAIVVQEGDAAPGVFGPDGGPRPSRFPPGSCPMRRDPEEGRGTGSRAGPRRGFRRPGGRARDPSGRTEGRAAAGDRERRGRGSGVRPDGQVLSGDVLPG